MRKFSIVLSTVVMLAMLLTACGGQQTSTSVPSTNVPPVTVESTSTSEANMTTTPEGGDLTTTPGVPVTGAENPSRLSNELEFNVVDQSGNKLGEVKDMVLDLDNTRVSYVAVGSGGVLDIGEKTVLIPWDSLTLQTGTSSTSTSSAENAFVLQADPQVLQNAPAVDLNSIIPAMGQAAANWDADIQNYWLSGGSSAVGTPSVGSGTATEAPAVSATSTPMTSGAAVSTATSTSSITSSTATPVVGAANGQGQGLGVGQAMPLQGVMLASKVIGTTISLNANVQQGQGQGAATAVATSSTSATGTSTETPSAAVISTATSTGNGIGNGNGTGLGNLEATIDDMIVETNTGMLQYLLVKTDLGNGDVWIPIPLNLIQWDATNNAFVINTSANILQGAPNFTEDQFPDTTTSGWDQQIATFWQSNGAAGNGMGVIATATP